MSNLKINSPYKGSGSLTREQFLFYEMRTTAKLMAEGLDDHEIYKRVLEENLFQYPTEKTVKSICRTCISRLHALHDDGLVQAIAVQPSNTAKQICLYAMMKQYRLVWDFMVTVIGSKYEQQNYAFGDRDIHVYFMQLQEQDDLVAGWSDATVRKIGSVLKRILIENEYLDDGRSEKINPVLLSIMLENAIRNNHDTVVLPAFNCFS